MKSSKIIIGVVIIIILLGLGYAFLNNGSNYDANQGANKQSNYQNQGNSVNPAKLSDMPYANKAYLISGESQDAKTQSALSGFELQKINMPDGSLNITLKAISSEYQDQNYIVKPGQQLYFIETSMGDDSPPNGEYNLADDHAVLVDGQGYIISQ